MEHKSLVVFLLVWFGLVLQGIWRNGPRVEKIGGESNGLMT